MVVSPGLIPHAIQNKNGGYNSKNGAYFLAIGCYLITGTRVYPSEVSLRWTNGETSFSFSWYMILPIKIEEKHRLQYSENKSIYGLTTEYIAEQKPLVTHKEMMRILMSEFSIQNNYPIHCKDISTIRLWTANREYTHRLTDCESFAPKYFSIKSVDQGGKKEGVALWDLAKKLATEGACVAHKEYSSHLRCAHKETLEMQQLWLIKQNLFGYV